MISLRRLRDALAVVVLVLLLGLAALSVAAVLSDSGPQPVRATVTESCDVYLKPAGADVRPDELQILPRACQDR